jgi:hypothetical protein
MMTQTEQVSTRIQADPVGILKRQETDKIQKSHLILRLNLALQKLIKEEDDSHRFFNQFKTV